MKKVLLASTALAMTAGAAAAEVALSGYAEIGIARDAAKNTVFHSDIDVTFTLSGSTDNGLTFGATIDLDEIGDDNNLPAGQGNDPIRATGRNQGSIEEQSVFVSGSFGTITMGDTDGAYDWALTEIAWGTTLTDDHTTHAGWNGNQGLDGGLNGQIARYDYTFGDFGIALSAEIGDGTDLPNTTSDDQILAIGGKWSGDWGSTGVSLGLGYQQGGFQTPAVRTGTSTAANLQGAGNAKIFGLSGAFAFQGGFEARLVYSTVDGTITAAGTTTGLNLDAKWDYGGIGFAYVMDEWIVEANWGQYDGTIAGNTVTPTNFKSDGYGVAVNYDLGGGAVAMAGYGRSNPFAANGVNIPSWSTWSIGLGLSF